MIKSDWNSNYELSNYIVTFEICTDTPTMKCANETEKAEYMNRHRINFYTGHHYFQKKYFEDTGKVFYDETGQYFPVSNRFNRLVSGLESHFKQNDVFYKLYVIAMDQTELQINDSPWSFGVFEDYFSATTTFLTGRLENQFQSQQLFAGRDNEVNAAYMIKPGNRKYYIKRTVPTLMDLNEKIGGVKEGLLLFSWIISILLYKPIETLEVYFAYQEITATKRE